MTFRADVPVCSLWSALLAEVHFGVQALGGDPLLPMAPQAPSAVRGGFSPLARERHRAVLASFDSLVA